MEKEPNPPRKADPRVEGRTVEPIRTRLGEFEPLSRPPIPRLVPRLLAPQIREGAYLAFLEHRPTNPRSRFRSFRRNSAAHRKIITNPRNRHCSQRAWVAKLGQRRRAQDPVL